MKFHLDFIPENPGFEINHGHKIFLLGSCFSENIGKNLQDHDFDIHSNPHGILFNPLSMQACLETLLADKLFDEKYILNRDGLFLSYLHHSSVHDLDKVQLLAKIQHKTQAGAAYLKEADILILTFGSAFVYRHLQLGETVANCHKQPGDTFEKKLLTTEEIVKGYSTLLNRLKIVNPQLKIIFTVSPVKYLREGVVENNLSKATLLLSIHQLVKQQPNCFYFPAYELVTDDLRDYRFYKEDLAHPNEAAIEYIWQKFSGCFFNTSTRELNKQIHKLNQALAHRQLTPTGNEDPKLRDFIAKQRELIAKYKS